MGCDHVITFCRVPRGHLLSCHGMGMVSDNTMYRQRYHRDCLINGWEMCMGMAWRRLPRRGYTFDRAGLMSAAKSTLSGRNPHRPLPPWGLYFFKFLAPFPHHPHFCEYVNYDDAMPRMVTCNAFDCTQKESTTPKGVAFHTPRSPG